MAVATAVGVCDDHFWDFVARHSGHPLTLLRLIVLEHRSEFPEVLPRW